MSRLDREALVGSGVTMRELRALQSRSVDTGFGPVFSPEEVLFNPELFVETAGGRSVPDARHPWQSAGYREFAAANSRPRRTQSLVGPEPFAQPQELTYSVDADGRRRAEYNGVAIPPSMVQAFHDAPDTTVGNVLQTPGVPFYEAGLISGYGNISTRRLAEMDHFANATARDQQIHYNNSIGRHHPLVDPYAEALARVSDGAWDRQTFATAMDASMASWSIIGSTAGALKSGFSGSVSRVITPDDLLARRNVHLASSRHVAWGNDLNAISSTVERLGQRALRHSGGDWRQSEHLFENLLHRASNRLARIESPFAIAIQPAAIEGGQRVPAFINLYRGYGSNAGLITDAAGNPRLFAFPGSRRLDAGITDLRATPNSHGLRPLVVGFDITSDASKPNIVHYYQEYFGGIPIYDIRF